MATTAVKPTDPLVTKCACPRFVEKTRAGEFLVNHTYECLLLRRGNRSLGQYYGELRVGNVN